MILPHLIVTISKAEKEKGLENHFFCNSTFLRYLCLICPRKKKIQYNSWCHDCETTTTTILVPMMTMENFVWHAASATIIISKALYMSLWMGQICTETRALCCYRYNHIDALRGRTEIKMACWSECEQVEKVQLLQSQWSNNILSITFDTMYCIYYIPSYKEIIVTSLTVYTRNICKFKTVHYNYCLLSKFHHF